MKSKFFKIKLLGLFTLAILSSNLNAFQIIGMDNIGQNFLQDVTAKVFDRYSTGTIFLGTNGNDATNVDPDFSVCCASRNDNHFFPLSAKPGTHAARGKIDYMALVNNGGQSATHVAVNVNDSNELRVITLANLYQDPKYVECGTLANDLVGSNGSEAFGLTALAGSQDFVFARVITDEDEGQYSGILAYKVNGYNDLARDGVYVPGVNSNYAAKLDNYQGQVSIPFMHGTVEYGDGSFLRAGSELAYMNEPYKVNDIYWDKDLQTLFIAGQVTVEKPIDEDLYNCYSVISKVQFDSSNLLTYTTGNLVITDALPVNVNSGIVGNNAIFASTVSTDVTELYHPTIYKIRTMKTSAKNPSGDPNFAGEPNYYLIVNGGIRTDDGTEPKNQIWALRYDPSSGYISANNSSAGTLGDEFSLNDLEGGNANSLMVGGENPPWDLTSDDHDPDFMDLEVVGDTVYVTINGQRSATNDPGVWASQAMFDDEGTIIGWTKWERVFPSMRDNFSFLNYDQTNFVGVDAGCNKMWKVGYTNYENQDTAANPRIVSRMSWDLVPEDLSVQTLVNRVSEYLNDGCKVILDLPAGTPGLSQTIDRSAKKTRGGYLSPNQFNSYTLFGGYEKIVFAQTEMGNDREVVTDYYYSTTGLHQPIGKYIQKTDLPSGAGLVRSLAYSRVALNDDENLASAGYFFAGTDTGLYVFAKRSDISGFDTTTDSGGLHRVNEQPFVSLSWQKVPGVGPVNAMDSDGQYLYFVEQDITSMHGITSKLYRVELGNNFDVTGKELIAQSGQGGIPANTIFTGFKLVVFNIEEKYPNASVDPYGIISTSFGLYKSTAALNIEDATSITWQIVDSAVATLSIYDSRIPYENYDSAMAYHSLYAPKRVPTEAVQVDGFNSKVIGITLADDPTKNLGIYQNSALYQFNSNIVSDGMEGLNTTALQDALYTDSTLAFLKLSGLTRHNPLEVLDRTTNLWTDGARRMFTRFNIKETKDNTTVAFPYYAGDWGMVKPLEIHEVSEFKSPVNRILCFENISGLGIIVAGTDYGIIALE